MRKDSLREKFKPSLPSYLCTAGKLLCKEDMILGLSFRKSQILSYTFSPVLTPERCERRVFQLLSDDPTSTAL